MATLNETITDLQTRFATLPESDREALAECVALIEGLRMVQASLLASEE